MQTTALCQGSGPRALHPSWGLWLKRSQVSKGLGSPAALGAMCCGRTEPRQEF